MKKPFEDRLDRLLSASLPERRNEVQRQIGKMKSEHAARGVLQSSMTVQRINEILGRELEARSIIIWQAIVRVHKIIGVDSGTDLADYFKALFRKYHDQSLTELTPIFEKETKNFRMSIPSNLQEVSNLAIKKHDIEIDLYMDSLGKSGEEKAKDQATTYNFYGAVGVVQSGAGAQANLVQNLGEPEKQDILSALEAIKAAIIEASSIDESSTTELVEIVNDSVSELSKTNPNNSRLRAFFDVLSGSIQSIASAGPAYQALKSALLPLGISLP
ncbi:MAG: hypothetical protein WD425_19290 [Nitrospirales bacterium]